MQTAPAPKKDAATFRIKKARKIEIVLKKDILKKIKTIQTKALLL